MAGRVIRILPIRSYDLSGLAAEAAYVFTVADRIDVSQYTMATLMVRWHSGDIDGGAQLNVVARASGYTDEDPQTTFTADSDLGSLTSTGAFAGPVYKTAELTAGDMGAMVSIGIQATQDPNGQQTIDPKLSIDLALKD